MRRTRAPSKTRPVETKAKKPKPARPPSGTRKNEEPARPRARQDAAAREPEPIRDNGNVSVPTDEPAREAGQADHSRAFDPVIPRGSINQHRLGRPRGKLQQPRLYGLEVEEARDFVRAAIRQTWTLDATVKAGAKCLPPLSRTQVAYFWQDVAAEMRADMEAQLPNERAVQAEQLKYELQQLHQQLDPKKPAQTNQTMTRIIAHRNLLAQITGTIQPLEVSATIGVDVRVTSASMQLLGGMSASDLERYIEMGRRVSGG